MAVAAYLSIPGVVGTDPAEARPHQGALPLASFSFGASNTGTGGTAGGGAGAGKASLSPLSFVPAGEVSSLLPLLLDVFRGTRLSTVTLTVDDPDPELSSLTFVFTDVVVTDDQQDYASPVDLDQPVQAVVLDYESVAITAQAGSGGGPPPSTPEAPVAIAVPLAAALAGGAVLAWRKAAAGSSHEGPAEPAP